MPMHPRPMAETVRPLLPSSRACILNLLALAVVPDTKLFEVLFLADTLQPLHNLAVAVVFLDRDMRHRRCRSCAVPMLVTRRAPDHIAGPDLLLGFAPTLGPADTGDRDQRLAARVRVPIASCAWLER